MRDRAACAMLDESERDALARSGRIRTLSAGETLFAAGDTDAGFATLTSGALKITSTDADGRERILALVHPAGFVGELFAPFADHDIVALTESRVCLFARSTIEDAVTAHPALGLALFRRSQEDLHQSRQWLDLAGRRSAEARVAGLVLALGEAASHSPCHPETEFELPLSRGEIASLLGLTIETVSRQLTALEREGLVQRNGARGIATPDPVRLRERAR